MANGIFNLAVIGIGFVVFAFAAYGFGTWSREREARKWDR